MQGICQFRASVGRNVAAVFGKQGHVHFPEGFQNFTAGEFFSQFLFQQTVYQQTDVTGQEVGFYAVFPSYKNRPCLEFCFHDPEVFFDFPAASVDVDDFTDIPFQAAAPVWKRIDGAVKTASGASDVPA